MQTNSNPWRLLDQPRRRTNGMTLVELLVVVMIVVVVLAAMVPQVRPALEEGRLREASRQINTYFAMAKSLAAQRGRPVGVAIQRAAPGSNAAFDLFMLETPPPYSGDLVGATATVRPVLANPTTISHFGIFFNNAASLTAPTTAALVQPGETFFIRFNYLGPLYQCTRDAGGGFRIAFPNGQPPPGFWLPGPDKQWGRPGTVPNAAGDDDRNGLLNDLREAGWPGSDDVAVGLPFQVFMFPTRSVVKPLQLTGGIAVDLRYSGYGVNGSQFAADNVIPAGPVDDKPVLIMFGPSGSVTTLYQGELTGSSVPLLQKAPTGTVYLLVGRFDQVLPPPIFNSGSGTWTQPASTGNLTNVEDLQSVWVAIETRNGAVSTAENVAPPATVPPTVPTLKQRRALIRTGVSMGGS